MLIPSSRSPRRNRRPPHRPSHWRVFRNRLASPNLPERGQAIALVALAFVVVLLFVGLLTDAGILYASYGQLKRANDAAAVAAATKFRVTSDKTLLTYFARQALELNGVGNSTLFLYICDNDSNGYNDQASAISPQPAGVPGTQFEYDFNFYCPYGSGTTAASRKYVLTYARQETPIYFLRLVGWETFTLTTSAVSEAASLDVVIVLDTSSSMSQTPCNNGSYPSNPKPCDANPNSSFYDAPNEGPQYTGDASAYGSVCNLEPSVGGSIDSDSDSIKACYPFYKVKDAAYTFIDKLNFPYDRVAIVTFDGERQDQCTGGNPWSSGTTFNNGVGDEDNCPFSARVNLPFTTSEAAAKEYVDGDQDASEVLIAIRDQSYTNVGLANPSQVSAFCSDPANYATTDPGLDAPEEKANAVVRYCVGSNVGGGMRVATNVFKQTGRQTAVWVMIFLSDGVTNLSDLPPILDAFDTGSRYAGACRGPETDAGVVNPPDFPSGWYLVKPVCSDNRVLRRYCADENGGLDLGGNPTCPPQVYGSGSYQMTTSYDIARYNVEDYARDMADTAALQVVCPANPGPTENCSRDANDQYNRWEPTGENTVIYAVGLGGGIENISSNIQDDDAQLTAGGAVLRYFAAVGDDGDRVTDDCRDVSGVPYAINVNCGQYYFAPNAFQLTKIFEKIAEKIFTRLSA